MILDGFIASKTDKKIIVVGNMSNKFGKHLTTKFGGDQRIVFPGTVYDKKTKHSLCFYCAMYFHGHSTGGTNPSLLEAMGSSAPIASHKNDFNKEVLGDDAFYFSNANEITNIIENKVREQTGMMIENNLRKIHEYHNWTDIINHYEKFIVYCYNQKNLERNIYFKGYASK